MTAQTRLGLIALGVVFGVILLLGGIIALATSTSIATPGGASVYEREELEKLVRDKKKDDVQRLLGKPDIVVGSGDCYGCTEWVYYKKSKHKDAKNVDAKVGIAFAQGVVIAVSFKNSEASK